MVWIRLTGCISNYTGIAIHSLYVQENTYRYYVEHVIEKKKRGEGQYAGKCGRVKGKKRGIREVKRMVLETGQQFPGMDVQRKTKTEKRKEKNRRKKGIIYPSKQPSFAC